MLKFMTVSIICMSLKQRSSMRSLQSAEPHGPPQSGDLQYGGPRPGTGEAGFPQRRLRRLRRTSALRRLTAEQRLHPDDFIAPLFVREGVDEPRPIASLPGQFQHSRQSLREEAAALCRLGISGVMLFGLPDHKDAQGSQAWHPDGVVQSALRDLRADLGDDMVLIADLCLDEYTDHGHCGVLDDRGSVDNDATLDLYARVATAQAEAGAHMVAPSGMMDGQVAAIRSALDGAGFSHLPILAYSAKYATALYGPFRDAVRTSLAESDSREDYQQHMANAREAMQEIRADLAEGADIVMVKPALPCLDVIARARRECDTPIAAYQVSGEYAMVHAAAERGWLDLNAVAQEQVLAVKRAGADVIITYFARRLCETTIGQHTPTPPQR